MMKILISDNNTLKKMTCYVVRSELSKQRVHVEFYVDDKIVGHITNTDDFTITSRFYKDKQERSYTVENDKGLMITFDKIRLFVDGEEKVI